MATAYMNNKGNKNDGNDDAFVVGACALIIFIIYMFYC